MTTAEHHTSRYYTGMKVEVNIPLQNTRTFRDWAIINEIDEDLVSLQLSRDVLPDGVILRIGQVLNITSKSDGTTYTCRAFIVSKGYEQDLLLRFTSETISNELREFFRVDAFIPVRFHKLYDQNPADARELWDEQRKMRREEEAARERRRLEEDRTRFRTEERLRKQNIHGDEFSNEPATVPDDNTQKGLDDNQYYESWADIPTPAVNISGGGLRIFTHQKFDMDELVLLELFVPPSRRIVDIVARVVSTNYISITDDDSANSSTAVHFVFIEESARSAINAHISSIQLKRIRQFKGFTDVEPASGSGVPVPNKHYAFIDTVEAGEGTDYTVTSSMSKSRKVLITLFFVIIATLLCFYFYKYAVNHPKSEIQEMFDNNFIKYRDNLKQGQQ
ncbi:MAG: DUF5634 family protein [Desulfuromonadaceae bacterium]|nr:DUF5634 family protein [Desulfuromonadaceae bacterium]